MEPVSIPRRSVENINLEHLELLSAVCIKYLHHIKSVARDDEAQLTPACAPFLFGNLIFNRQHQSVYNRQFT